MRINNPSFEIWDQEPGLDGIYRQIERVGRVCYKSEDHQTADSARPFVERMIKNEHYAMLEHGSVFLTISLEGDDKLSAEEREQKANNYISNRFSRVVIAGGKAFVSTNLRVLAENGWLDDLAFLTEPTDHHERRVTVHFTTQIGITREFNRHRADSMAEQSTRYCNYSKAKFGNEITINIPTWVKHEMTGSEWSRQLSSGMLKVSGQQFMELARKVADGSATLLDSLVFADIAAEKSYMNLIAS